jgi:hypothetical protein
MSVTASAPAQTLYGLTVESQIDLHQRRPASPGVPPDVVIRRGAALTSNHEPPPGRVLVHHVLSDDMYYTFAEQDDGGCVLRFAGACDFEVAPGLREVTVRVVDGSDPELAGVLASGALLSFLLMMRGEPVLHASAVDVGGRAIAFVGYSGMGKSTMAALVAAHGGRLVTDDVLRLDLSDRVVRCYLGATELRLRKAAGELAQRFRHDVERRVTSDRRDALRLVAATDTALPLGALVVPRPRRDVERLEVVRQAAVDAMLALVRYPRILGWQDPRVQAQQFEHLATLAERVPVYLADVPWGPPFAGDLAPRLLDAVGLAAAASRSAG